MSETTSARKPVYSRTAQYLHWAVAAMIVLQFVLIEIAEGTSSRIAVLGLFANHKSVGMTILMLAVLRLGWRLANRPPKLPAEMPAWQVQVSALTHWALYAFLFAMPISGWLMSSAANYSVSWFGLFTWPDLVSPDEGLKETLKTIHDLLGKALFVFALLHVLAACKHHFLDKDDVLKRMSAAVPLVLFGLIIAGGTWALGSVGQSTESTNATDSGTAAQTQPASTDAVAESSDLPLWRIDFNTSFIEFTATQAGAPFTGEWADWQAKMRFDEQDLANSQFDVMIATSGVSTDDTERDETLQDSDFFDTENHPTVRFLTSEITKTDDGYLAQATLTVKGTAYPVEFLFDVAVDGETRVLSGEARLDRLALGLGLGEWADTEWVGQYVDVLVGVSAVVSD